MTAPLWRVCRHADFDRPAITAEIARCHETPRLHRKQWEYAYVLETARRLGLIRPGARALGLGVGREPVVAVLAAEGMAVTATERDWIGLGATPPLQAPGLPAARWRGLNDRAILGDADFDARVSFRYLDAADPAGLPADLAGRFDLVWSCSLLHVLPDAAAAGRALHTARRALAPGGWALHSFDLLLEAGAGETLGGMHFPAVPEVEAWHADWGPPRPGPDGDAGSGCDLGPGPDPRDRIPDRGEPGAPHICVLGWNRLIGTAGIAVPAASVPAASGPAASGPAASGPAASGPAR